MRQDFSRLLTALGGAAMMAISTHAAAQSVNQMRNGHPDLTGFWNGNVGAGAARKGDDEPQYYTRDGTLESFEDDGQILARGNTNRPVYKPQYWDKIRELDWNNGRQSDPSFKCFISFPRFAQAPEAIFQTDNHVVLILNDNGNWRRIVPTDGRPHNPDRAVDQTWLGDSVGKWEGDTLVIHTTGFTDESWFKYTGYIHSNELETVERIRREGDILHYSITAIDPMLMEPWTMTNATLNLNKDPDAIVPEEAKCEERGGDFAAALSPEIGR